VALNAYVSQVQRLLHDPSASYYNAADLQTYINEARGQVALEGQCIRVLLPSTSGVSSVTVTAGGAGYTVPPTVTFVGPGTGATGHAVTVANAVTQVIVDTPGSGYDKSTTVVFGGPGTGATATIPFVINNTVFSQELYTFASLQAVARLTPGVNGLLGVLSIAVSWGSMKPTMRREYWSTFQAYCRSNSVFLQSWPAVWASYGQGAAGSIYVYPLPSQIMQWDWDTFCQPIDLLDDTTVEAIPYPYTDAIKFYAAMLAFDNSQRKDDAARMQAAYERYMQRASKLIETPFIPDEYDSSDYF
jgi:hypothetical protein